MYSKFSEEKKWKVEIISQSLSDLGGFKEVVAKISGQQVYSKLKFESGGPEFKEFLIPKHKVEFILVHVR